MTRDPVDRWLGVAMMLVVAVAGVAVNLWLWVLFIRWAAS